MTKFTTFSLFLVASTASAATIDFSDQPLPPNTAVNALGGFVSGGAYFNNDGITYGSTTYYNGWTRSTVSNTTAPGSGNAYAAITGAGVGGSGTYAVGFPEAFINLPAGLTPGSVRLTNTTYDYLSIRDGDQFGKKFGGASGNDPDFFKVTFTGYADAGATGAPTGSVDFFLADFRPADNSLDRIVNTWETLDLSGLGDARSIALSFDSSDRVSYDGGQTFYLNTPTYVAIDDLVLVPEPATLAALGGAALLAIRRRHRGSRGL